MRILLAVEPTDFRRGIDGLAKVARSELGSDPFSGTLFVFHNRRGTAVKLLLYDGQGFWLCQKRLSRGRYRHWPTKGEGRSQLLKGVELQLLLSGGDPCEVSYLPEWRGLNVGS